MLGDEEGPSENEAGKVIKKHPDDEQEKRQVMGDLTTISFDNK